MKGVERPRNVHYQAVILTLSLPKGKDPPAEPLPAGQNIGLS